LIQIGRRSDLECLRHFDRSLDILRSLGFSTQKLGNQGRGLRMSKDLVHKIHTTAKNLGLCRADTFYPEVTESGFGGPPCSVCEEVGLMFDHDGRRLQSPKGVFEVAPWEP
jgi:hypothetical protein